MTRIGTPFTSTATKVLLCGSGELGKEVVIELQRFGVEVIAVDAYPNAPAMQVADRAHVVSMLDGAALRRVIESERPQLIVPEVEAIATDTLAAIEAEGLATIIPTARAAQLTMNREGIRRLAAEDLGLRTSPYRFAATEDEYRAAITEIGLPCVVKPIMSSSGKGQSTAKSGADIERAWKYAQEGGRAGRGKVIVEGFVEFDYEITQLTVRHAAGTAFCDPIGHLQIDGDYRESWQPQPMSELALTRSREYAKAITDALGGRGIFGVELFVKGDDVWFSEVSPRPHDTGMVTMISQDLSQFALHARAGRRPFEELIVPAEQGVGLLTTEDLLAGMAQRAKIAQQRIREAAARGKKRHGETCVPRLAARAPERLTGSREKWRTSARSARDSAVAPVPVAARSTTIACAVPRERSSCIR